MNNGACRHVLAVLMIGSFTTAACAEASASDRFAADPFAKGSRFWSATAAGSRKPSLAWFALTQFKVNYYLVDNLAIQYGGQFGYVESQRTTGGAFGGPELGMRWHVATGVRWSLYIESLAGAVYQQHPITPASLRFNFDLQGGGGATYRVSDSTMFAGGVRSHHLSNARVHGRNQNMGYDAVMLYLELLKSF